MSTLAISPSSTPSHNALPQPPARRPSTLRRSSSSSIILAPIARFSPDPPAQMPPPIFDSKQSPTHYDSPSRPPVGGQHCSFSSSSSNTTSKGKGTAAEGQPAPPARPPIKPTTSSTSSGSSLLQRRRSSQGAHGRERPAFAITELKLPSLPTPPLAELPLELSQLDDKIPETIIGESSAAVTPASEGGGTPGAKAAIVERPFKPTRTFVATPFPEKKSFLPDDDDDDEDSSADEAEAGDTSRDTL
ncbi:hypothetical protein BCR35DRAFT_167050 [Leucosporidium creatinivorum]|uniref:Uncharacterized protein n=1 Tax=Leucosporidium creatinivorum TaxID=106004 RepID=A0A1Y2EGC3_9BASI|nr:hypothetical protein BCR35DRAFT_167050 [Leucosporidium creatinivorum]